ncbi:MAG: helix-turn-helix domain-containing protein [Rhodobacteraceae bacterium]|nr:helix-turn-helix domain-containing protein [Paracoccaceae bacterium]
MTGIAIDATRLKTIRKARKIGRPKLAKLAGVSERQLAKLEGANGPLLSEAVLRRLSEALQIPLPTLTGEFPLIEEDLEPVAAQPKSCSCCG